MHNINTYHTHHHHSCRITSTLISFSSQYMGTCMTHTHIHRCTYLWHLCMYWYAAHVMLMCVSLSLSVVVILSRVYMNLDNWEQLKKMKKVRDVHVICISYMFDWEYDIFINCVRMICISPLSIAFYPGSLSTGFSDPQTKADRDAQVLIHTSLHKVYNIMKHATHHVLSRVFVRTHFLWWLSVWISLCEIVPSL